MPRVFLAIPVTPTEGLRTALAALRDLGRPVRPVPASQLHLTLRFLGEIAEGDAATAAEALEAAGAGFPLDFRGMGAFPGPVRPRVVWAGIAEAAPLHELAHAVHARLERAGFPPPDRPFQPHLTLARIKGRPPGALRRLLAEHESADFGVTRAARLDLVQSTLTDQGPRHHVRASRTLS